MRKRRLNKRGKITLSIMTILASTLIYILTVVLGTKAQESVFHLAGTITAWIWLFMGQFGAYYLIWEKELNF